MEFIKGFGTGFCIGFCLWLMVISITLEFNSSDAYNRSHLREACAVFDAIPASEQQSPILCKKGKHILVVRGKRGHYKVSAEER